MTISSTAAAERRCHSCLGTGEVGTESGPVDCPDCGGSGILPHPHVAVEWRVRDIERLHAARTDAVSGDLRWLIAELRRARTALTEIAALADDAGETEVARRLRFTVNRALELYPVGQSPADGAAAGHRPAGREA
ncbi:MAG TPA: hypothetical protein VMG12_28515 [Polyangiaceae bacterium]|nr:hypothetical protein [Polyangiaceae bacterium]